MIFIFFKYLVLSSLSCYILDLHCILPDDLLWCTDPPVLSYGRQSVQASVVVGHRPSCLMACGIPVPESPELQGELSTTGPPGKFPGFHLEVMKVSEIT